VLGGGRYSGREEEDRVLYEVCLRIIVLVHTLTFTGIHDRGRIAELATNCYGCHVLQKALDCEEDIRLLVVSELLLGDPAQTLVNKHASHVWSKVCFSYSSYLSVIDADDRLWS
jgi:hypothetical protein